MEQAPLTKISWEDPKNSDLPQLLGIQAIALCTSPRCVLVTCLGMLGFYFTYVWIAFTQESLVSYSLSSSEASLFDSVRAGRIITNSVDE